MAGSLKVRLLEVFISLPISACIVSDALMGGVWCVELVCGWRTDCLVWPDAQGGAGLATHASSLDHPNFANGDVGDVPAGVHSTGLTQIGVIETRIDTSSNEKQFAAFLVSQKLKTLNSLETTH
eukprot:9476339-Pyramimonas_sp.AAC.1